MLIAGPNFGIGSSREHAVWALMENCIQAVISPKFGDIFRNNSTKTGLVPVVVDPEVGQRAAHARGDGRTGTADLDRHRQPDVLSVPEIGDRDRRFRWTISPSTACWKDSTISASRCKHADEITEYRKEPASLDAGMSHLAQAEPEWALHERPSFCPKVGFELQRKRISSLCPEMASDRKSWSRHVKGDGCGSGTRCRLRQPRSLIGGAAIDAYGMPLRAEDLASLQESRCRAARGDRWSRLGQHRRIAAARARVAGAAEGYGTLR